MSEEKKNSDHFDETVQVVETGALVKLDDVTLQHGVLFMRPGMTPFKLHLELDENGELHSYTFEPIYKRDDKVTRFYVHDAHKKKIEPAQPKPSIIRPNGHKLIIPERG